MTTKIAGMRVDPDKPEEVLKALELARLKIASGSKAETVWFGDDKIQYSQGNLKELKELIAEYEGRVARQSGKPRPRKRFAMRWRF